MAAKEKIKHHAAACTTKIKHFQRMAKVLLATPDKSWVTRVVVASAPRKQMINTFGGDLVLRLKNNAGILEQCGIMQQAHKHILKLPQGNGFELVYSFAVVVVFGLTVVV